MDKRNSFAKTVYTMLFSWLVEKVNSTIAPTLQQEQLRGYIGLLDIYGFENFYEQALNSFEQLLINYGNEKLQCHFNVHIFRIEQAEYESESIDWSYIEFRYYSTIYAHSHTCILTQIRSLTYIHTLT